MTDRGACRYHICNFKRSQPTLQIVLKTLGSHLWRVTSSQVYHAAQCVDVGTRELRQVNLGPNRFQYHTLAHFQVVEVLGQGTRISIDRNGRTFAKRSPLTRFGGSPRYDEHFLAFN